jgi:hypothetical protein
MIMTKMMMMIMMIMTVMYDDDVDFSDDDGNAHYYDGDNDCDDGGDDSDYHKLTMCLEYGALDGGSTTQFLKNSKISVYSRCLFFYSIHGNIYN